SCAVGCATFATVELDSRWASLAASSPALAPSRSSLVISPRDRGAELLVRDPPAGTTKPARPRRGGQGLTPRRTRDPFLEQHGGWGSGETLRHSLGNAQGRERMGCYVLGFQEIDQTQVAVVGGKGAHLGELSRIEGLRVPAGFCVTTDAFQRIMAEAPSIDDRLDRLSRLRPDDREAIRALSAEIRRTLEGIAIPDDLAAAITG